MSQAQLTELMMNRIYIILFGLFIISCDETPYNFVPYDFKVNSNCEVQIEDSLLVIRYTIQNLDSVNYYIPGSEIWFSGSSDGGYTIASSPGNIYSLHFINYFPLNTMFKAFFELNSKYTMTKMPFFYIIKPNDQFEISIEVLPLTQATGKVVNNFSSELDYNFISRFSIINEVELSDLMIKLKHTKEINKIKFETDQIFLSNHSKDKLKKLNFETTILKIDSTQSDLINEYLQNYIEVHGTLINKNE